MPKKKRRFKPEEFYSPDRDPRTKRDRRKAEEARRTVKPDWLRVWENPVISTQGR